MIRTLLRKIGEILSWIERKLSPRLRAYLRSKLSVRSKALLKRLLSSSKAHVEKRVEFLKIKLYSLGFVDRASSDLVQLYEEASHAYEKSLAAWELALWHASKRTENDWRLALKYLDEAVKGNKSEERQRQATLVKAETFFLLGDHESAEACIRMNSDGSSHPDLLLAKANLTNGFEQKIDCLNKALDLLGPSSVAVRQRESVAYPVQIHHPDQERLGETSGSPKITVITPVYERNDEGVKAALEALLMQTWSNIEIIVADASDGQHTQEIVTAYREEDARIKYLNLDPSISRYTARMAALKEATGEYVTCCHLDQLPHPERLKAQVEHLLDHPTVLGNIGHSLLIDKDFHFYRPPLSGSYLVFDPTTLMFRRKPILEQVGGWDHVSNGADEEFVARIKKHFGDQSIVILATKVLSFRLIKKDEREHYRLPGSEAHLWPGALREYRESYLYFHQQYDNVYFDCTVNRPRPFPAPFPLLSRIPLGERHYDVILASDFRLVGGSTMSSVEEIKAQNRMGLRTGLIQMARYDVDPTKKVHPKIRELIDGDQVQVLVHGDDVSCDTLILRYPPILHERQIFLPKVEAKEIRVIVNQPPMSDYGPDAVLRYNIQNCQQHIKEYFGRDAVWHPIGPLVREALYTHHSADLNLIQLSEEDWVNIIDVDEWRREDRLPSGPKIKIGRHSRDHPVKWPDDPQVILTIYPDSDPYEVYILGGASVPLNVLKYKPANWHIYKFGEIHPREFLKELDVFVYYTHPDWVEAFGRVIIEAMAVGVPVILPHQYRDLFGDAAIYAEPDEVREKIDQLIIDPERYLRQVKQARAFVEINFGYAKHASRLGLAYRSAGIGEMD